MNRTLRLIMMLICIAVVFMQCKKSSPDVIDDKDVDWGEAGKGTVLWGATDDVDTDKGYIFKINGDGSGFEKVFSFTAESGYNVNSAMCLASNGKLYGTTKDGGQYDRGTWFCIDPTTKKFSKIADFNRDAGIKFVDSMFPLIENRGKIYHQAYLKDIFSMNLNDHKINWDFDHSKWVQGGAFDSWVLGGGIWTPGFALDSKGIFFGISDVGIFKYNPAVNKIDAIHRFEEPTGGTPSGKMLLASDGKLYGMTGTGGKFGKGVIYRVNPESGDYEKLYDFDTQFGGNSVAGHSPANFIELSNDELFSGMSASKSSLGRFFSYNIKTGALKILFDLNTTDKAQSRFVDDENTGMRASDGMIYGFCSGTTPQSVKVQGANVMYQFDPNKGRIRAIYVFDNIKSGVGWPVEVK